MICVNQVKVFPSKINIKTGQAYTDATAQVSPPNATNPSVKWSSSNPKVVYVNPYNGTMSGVSEGTATVYATAQDDSGKKDCCTVVVSKSIPVSRITLAHTNLQLEINRSIDVPVAKISPDDADNKTVKWCSDNPDVATIANGKIYAHSEGSATITVTATDGSGVSASCKVTVYKTIYVSSVTLNTYSQVMRVGESVILRAEVWPCEATDRRIIWLSSDEEIATVNPTSGLVIAQKPGTTTIRAESLDSSGKRGVCTVTVKEKIPIDSITLDKTELRLRPGDCYKLSRIICPSNATDQSLLWYSNNPDVATVSNGVIRAKSVGDATISVSPTGGGSKPVAATCKVWVSDYTPVSSVTVSPSSHTMTVNESIALHATVCPENATNKWLEWKSSNEKVATVHRDSGLVFAQGPGTAVIAAMTLEGMGVFGSCQITVKDVVPVSSIKVCPVEKSIRVGESTCLTATVYPRDATNQGVRWSCDNPHVATIDRLSGEIHAKMAGTATITAITVDGGFTTSSTVVVTQVLTGADIYIDDQNIINTIINAKNLSDVAYDMYLSGSISCEQLEKMQREAKYAADLARADYVVVNDQSNFAYQYFKGRNYQNGDISPFNRELTYCEDEPLTGLDIMIIQRGMQAIGYFEPDENYRYGTYDLDTFNAAFNNNVLWGIGREIFDEGSYRVVFNSDNRSQRTPQWLLDLQEYSRQHRITQYAVAARTLGKIEVPINGGGPSGKFAGRADVFRERSQYSEIWEVKHSNPRNLQVGDRQLQRYQDAAENKPQQFMTPLLRGYDFQTFYVPYDLESCLEISSTSVKGLVFYQQVPIPIPEPEYAPVPFPESQKEYELTLKPIPIGTVLAVSISIVCIAGGIYILATTGDPVPFEEGLRDLGRVLGYA